MQRNTEQRVAAVTGASSGIGREVAVQLGALGWSVAVGARRMDRLAETAAAVRDAGGTAFAHPLDVGDADSVETFFSATEAELGTVQAVVNNAGTARYGPLWDFSPDEIRLEIDTKLLGSLLVSRRAILALLEAKVGGDLLFVTSISAVSAWPSHLPYAASGAGVEHAARTLKLELEGTGIRVHTLRCDGTAGTDFGTRERELGRTGPALETWFRHGLQRHHGFLTVEQVAEAVVDALTLPPGLQYDVFTLTPVAPVGPLPRTFEDYISPFLPAAAPEPE